MLCSIALMFLVFLFVISSNWKHLQVKNWEFWLASPSSAKKSCLAHKCTSKCTEQQSVISLNPKCCPCVGLAVEKRLIFYAWICHWRQCHSILFLDLWAGLRITLQAMWKIMMHREEIHERERGSDGRGDYYSRPELLLTWDWFYFSYCIVSST